MAKDRPPSFQFYPRDYLTDAAVVRMSLAARGAYVHLLCHSWLSDSPGIIPDDDAVLAVLSEARERWPEIRAEVVRAFEIRACSLRQRRMIIEREAQKNRYVQSRKGARVTNEARWGSVARRPDSDTFSDRTAVTPSSSSSKESEPNTSCSSATADSPTPATNGKPKPTPNLTAAFAEFWAAYPRRVGKRAAEAAYTAALKRSDPAAILAGLERAKTSDQWTRDAGQFIPHPRTWLSQDRWADETPQVSAPAEPEPQWEIVQVSATERAYGRIRHGQWEFKPMDANGVPR